MASYKIETINHLHRHGYNMRLRCPCGHDVSLSVEQLLARIKGTKVGWKLDDIAANARCSACKRRGVPWTVALPPDGPLAPLGVDAVAWANARDDRERKRLIRQARG